MTINSSWQFAQLAQAAYIDLSSKSSTVVQTALANASNAPDKKFSVQQAAKLLNSATGYSVADISANKNDAVGFSATLFRGNADGKYVLAIRGTEPLTVDIEYSIGQNGGWASRESDRFAVRHHGRQVSWSFRDTREISQFNRFAGRETGPI